MDTTPDTTAPVTATLAEQLAHKPAPKQARKPRADVDPSTGMTHDETRAEAKATREAEAMVLVTRETLGIASARVPQHSLDALREVQAIGMLADATACTDKQVKQAASVYRAALVNALTDCGFTLHQARSTTTGRK